MDQDELEEEIFTKTILTHLDFLSTYTRGLYEWQKVHVRTELLYAVAFVVGLLMVAFARKCGLFRALRASATSNEDSLEQRSADAAVFAIKGRRPGMEDRFVLVQIPTPHLPEDPIVRLFAILDGHGGQYSAVYVKKHLVESLVTKIKLLKVLACRSKIGKATTVKTMERLSEGCVTKPVLDLLGMSVPEYKKLNPGSGMFKKDTIENKSSPAKQVTNPVLSPRVKTLEETVTNVPKDDKKKETSAKDASEKGDDAKVCDHEGHAHNDMLSPYGNVATKKQPSKSPARRQNSSSNPSSQDKDNCSNSINTNSLAKKDITDYISASGNILYPDLLSDEIGRVDEKLLKSCKKEGQVGGTTLLLALLDGTTLWVANVGDSRGVMRNAKGDVIPLSFDHKPSQLKEKRRIEEAGGYVSLNGVWRVQGVLATSRALGDFPLKDRKFVVCEPDVLSFRLDVDEPDFAILASDGLWDTHSNEGAIAHVQKFFKDSDSVLCAAKSLTRDAFDKGSTDNISVMILNLKNMI